MKRLHVFLLLFLVGLVILTLGFPHQEEAWFESFFPAEGKEKFQYILLTEFRIPRLVIALVAGASLSVCGLLLQTLLNNPLAGPSILGLTSGAHLFVALTILAAGYLSGTLLDLSITVASAVGSLLFGLIILLMANRVKSQVSLLLVGMMLGTFVSAVTGILLSKSDPTALKAFTLWSFGSLQQVSLNQLPLIVVISLLGISATFFLVKPLNGLVLGERQATVLGVHLRRSQWQILAVVSVLTGLVTAFCGPIAFVGLIVPNIVKIFYKTANHRVLLIGTIIIGAGFMLLCDLLIVVMEPVIVLPINSLTSLIGAPVAVALLLKKMRHA
ncbi:MAG: iron ABC transporter permease [Fluviicola sp.]|nr:iron ABC transporter permease [Fluviicola sp.]